MDEPINHFRCVESFDRETDQPLGCEWEFILTDQTVAHFSREVFPHIEIELMQGTQTKLPDGRTRYTFALDSERSEPIRQSLVLAVIQINQN